VQTIGLLISSSQKMAPIIQASLQYPHPIHLVISSFTPPSSLGTKAPVGHTLAQGESEQARQTITINPRSIPPADLIPILDLAKPASPFHRAQANIQL